MPNIHGMRGETALKNEKKYCFVYEKTIDLCNHSLAVLIFIKA